MQIVVNAEVFDAKTGAVSTTNVFHYTYKINDVAPQVINYDRSCYLTSDFDCDFNVCVSFFRLFLKATTNLCCIWMERDISNGLWD